MVAGNVLPQTDSTPGLSPSLAPAPKSLADTGLSQNLLMELTAKHLHSAGDLDLKQLGARLGLGWQIVEQILTRLRDQAYLEVRSPHGSDLRFGLTEKGRTFALASFEKSGYVDCAPVPLALYMHVVAAQSSRQIAVCQQDLVEAYADAEGLDDLFPSLGPALISGRAIFLYGDPGTGKTYVAQRFSRLLRGEVLIPHAISVHDQIVRVFDPVVHRPVPQQANPSSLFASALHDGRFVTCKRPAVIVGGELTLDMLELGYDTQARTYLAPSHLKANNGVFVIDDLGRQRARAADLLNRWIVPLEEKRDFLTLTSGGRFEVPAEFVLVFSTNLLPKDLADEAFLRRLGYKLKFRPLTREQFSRVWQHTCARAQVPFDAEALNILLDEYYGPNQTPLLPCHPRDLIGLVADQCRYAGQPLGFTRERLAQAWRNYFVE